MKVLFQPDSLSRDHLEFASGLGGARRQGAPTRPCLRDPVEASPHFADAKAESIACTATVRQRPYSLEGGRELPVREIVELQVNVRAIHAGHRLESLP